MIILAIETSCDDTSIAILNNSIPLSCITQKQTKIHNKFGGIIPEVASREHQKVIGNIFLKALDKANIHINKISLIAVTHGPGLMGSLIVGAQFARGLSIRLNKPLIAINHIEAHVFSSLIGINELPEFPWISLVLSGGHTILLFVDKEFNYKLLGETTDDAIGECFDKIARHIGLGYPGGPVIERLAKKGKPIYKFPESFINEDSYRFSYSGIKTAVINFLEKNKSKIEDVCASFQKAAFSPILIKTKKAIKEFKPKSLLVGGGVIANNYLKVELKKLSKRYNVKLFLPEKKYAMDNAAMIGTCAYYKYIKDKFILSQDKVINPRWKIHDQH